MFYKNKETKDVVFLVRSDSKRSIIFDYTKEGTTSAGRILEMNKKMFKKQYIKFKKCEFDIPSEDMQKVILDDYDTNRYAYDNNMEEYVEYKKYLDRKEEIEKQTEADRRRLIKELADDYNPNGIKVKD